MVAISRKLLIVDIGTEWNLEDIVPERIVITGWSRYRNRVEFRACLRV